MAKFQVGQMMQSEKRTGAIKPQWVPLLAVASAAALFSQACWFQSNNSITFDENFYLPAAKQIFMYGNFDRCTNWGVAPLPVVLAYGPAVALRGNLIADTDWGMTLDDPATLDIARKTHAIVIGIPLIYLCGFWVYRRTNSLPAAGAASLLAALSPQLITHSALATTDACFTLFFLLSLAAIAHHALAPSPTRFLLVGVAVGLTILAKYSAVLLFPIGYLVGVWADVSYRPRLSRWNLVRRALVNQPVRQIGIALVAALVGWVVTGFSLSETPLARFPAAETSPNVGWRRVVGNGPFGDFFIEQAHKLYPPAFFVGFTRQMGSVMSEPVPTYLFGIPYPKGHRLYYVYALFMKSTPAEIVLLMAAIVGTAASIVAFCRGRQSANLFTFALLLGCGLLFLACSLSAKQAGVRYILPLYPTLIILGVSAITEWLAHRRMVLLVTLGLLVAAQAYASLSIAPRHLSYFNTFVGGPERGPDLLGTVDVDWDQGLIDLKRFLDGQGEPCVVVPEHDIPPMHANPIRLKSYGITAHPWDPDPPCRYIVISLWCLYYAKRDSKVDLDPFRRIRPSAVVGYSIYVYDLRDPVVQEAFRMSLQQKVRSSQ